MKKRFLWLGLLALATGSAQAGDLYRWLDTSGKVHYGDTPAADALKVEQRKFSVVPAEGGADLPYETRRAQQNFPVTMYVSDNCGITCQQAREFLNKRGIPFAEVSLRTKEEFDAFIQLSGSDSAPTLAVGKAWLKGFRAGEWDSELDIAGYPKTLPYRPPSPAQPLTLKPATGQ